MRVRPGIAILVVTFLLMGCSSPHPLPTAPTPIPQLNPATMAPDAVQPTEPPPAEPAATPVAEPGPAVVGDAVQGRQVFDGKCSVCHDLSYQTKVGPGLAGLFADQSVLPNGQPFTEASLREWIANGGGMMPGIPLAEREMDDLIAFLRQETQ